MEVFLTCQQKMKKKPTNKWLKWEETMITWQAIYWIMSTFQKITN